MTSPKRRARDDENVAVENSLVYEKDRTHRAPTQRNASRIVANFGTMNQEPRPSVPAAHSSRDTDRGGAFQKLQRSIEVLGGDPEYIALALAEFFSAMPPLGPSQLSAEHKHFLVESGEFTQSELEATQLRVERGSLAIRRARSFAHGVYSTLSVEDAAGFLGWEQRDVMIAADTGRLYSVVVAGRTRFPVWQFQPWAPDKLLPGLEAITALAADWNWQTLAGLMSVPQGSLRAEGPHTPPEWLRMGGDIDAVMAIIAGGPAKGW